MAPQHIILQHFYDFYNRIVAYFGNIVNNDKNTFSFVSIVSDVTIALKDTQRSKCKRIPIGAWAIFSEVP